MKRRLRDEETRSGKETRLIEGRGGKGSVMKSVRFPEPSFIPRSTGAVDAVHDGQSPSASRRAWAEAAELPSTVVVKMQLILGWRGHGKSPARRDGLACAEEVEFSEDERGACSRSHSLC